MLKIIDNFLPTEDLKYLDELYDHFYYSGSWQFDFFSSSYVSGGNYKTNIEKNISYIIKKLCEEDFNFVGKGYEPWINVLNMDEDHLNHHVDCDEESEGVVPAKMTAVLYLGAGFFMEGGELAICLDEPVGKPKFYSSIYELVKKIDNSWIKVPYKYNRLVLFDSNYSHAVLPIKYLDKDTARIALTISSWDKKINIVR